MSGILCVGGPKDGQAIECDQMYFVAYEVVSEPVRDNFIPLPIVTASARQVTYTRRVFGTTPDKAKHFYAPNYLTDDEAIEALVSGYRQPKAAMDAIVTEALK